MLTQRCLPLAVTVLWSQLVPQRGFKGLPVITSRARRSHRPQVVLSGFGVIEGRGDDHAGSANRSCRRNGSPSRSRESDVTFGRQEETIPDADVCDTIQLKPKQDERCIGALFRQ